MNNYTKNTTTSLNLKKLDQVGIFFSGACTIHCLLIPILTFLAPALTSYFENEWIHLTSLFFIIPIAALSFVRQRKIHGHHIPLVLGLLGITILLSSFLFELISHLHIKGFELTFTIIGSLFLITAHIQNIKSLKSYYKGKIKWSQD